MRRQLMGGGLIVAAGLAPFAVADENLLLLATACAAAIGAIGLNIVLGYAGQISFAHALFLGVGAYTAAAISGARESEHLGYGITFLPLWVLAGGAAAAAVGLLLAPIAVRLRGLYLAVVSLGMVFLGVHVFSSWTALTGGPGVGRPAATGEMFGIRFDVDGTVFTHGQKLYWLMLGALLLFGAVAHNVVRGALGRAFAAVRDHDVAAAMMGIDLTRTKLLAFALSSFYAGVAGALLYTVTGYLDPGSFGVLLSVEYISMVLIGGVASISGSILGAFFVTLLPRLARELPRLAPVVALSPSETPNVFQIESILYGCLIIGFLLYEPRGLTGLARRLRNHWRVRPSLTRVLAGRTVRHG